MRNVICVWHNGKAGFEKNIPLEFVARRNEKLGYVAEIDVIVLDGFANFSPEYKATLSRLNFRLIDCTTIYRKAETEYSALARFGDYERKCFLRWIVLRRYYRDEALIHYDGDVVFNVNPNVVSGLLANKTFVLQGCPAFTCVSDVGWHDAYGAALNDFVADIEEYSREAWIKREGWETSDRERWAGQRYRKIITSDQDFLSHLIHTRQIRQDSPRDIAAILSGYTLFENPLYVNAYPPWQYASCAYRRVDGVDYINDQKVFLWHMQSNFSEYLSKFLIMTNLLKCNNHFVTYKTDEPDRRPDVKNRIAGMLNRFIAYPRLDIYQHFFGEHDFSEVFQDVIWWKSGVFEKVKRSSNTGANRQWTGK